MQKQEQFYAGKAKSVYATDNPEQVIIEYRNDISAFNAEKLAKLKNKGAINNKINAFIMEHLSEAGINTHHIKLLNDSESLVYRLEMIPVECVVRNVVAGSLAKRLGLDEGTVLAQPIFEFFYKDDALGDPLINRSHVIVLGWATEKEVELLEALSLQVNNILKPLFANKGMLLVDYKLEFGRYQGELFLGDEITPDGCRIWDIESKEKMDKDRFRRDLGDVVDHYQQVALRLGVTL